MPVSASMISANVFIDDFNRANGTIGSNYQIVSGSTVLLTISNNVVTLQSGVPVQLNCISTGSKLFLPNQEAQLTYAGLRAFDFCGPAVRVNPTDGTGYVLRVDAASGGREFGKIVGQQYTALQSVGVPTAVGDTMTIRADGNVISVYKNKQFITSIVDNTYTSGQPGIYYLADNVRQTFVDNFIAADIPTTNAKSLCIVSQTPVGKLIVGSQ